MLFLGALRSSAQVISYEVSLGIIMMPILVTVGSLNLTDIVLFQTSSIWFIVPYFPSFLMFFIVMLAETNRPPFDLPEAEAELVSGYHVEYSAVGFALFFIAEYANIILMSCICVILYFGGWSFMGLEMLSSYIGVLIFCFKVICVLFLFIWVRAAFPRYRYDQLMILGWKVLLPFSISYLMFISIVLFIFNGLPIIYMF